MILVRQKCNFWPIENRWTGNLFYGNRQNISYTTGWGADDVADPEDIAYIEVDNNIEIGMDIFADPTTLNFSYSNPNAQMIRPPSMIFSISTPVYWYQNRKVVLMTEPESRHGLDQNLEDIWF